MNKIHDLKRCHDVFMSYNDASLTMVLYPKNDYRFDTTNGEYIANSDYNIFSICEMIEEKLGYYSSQLDDDFKNDDDDAYLYWEYFYDNIDIENVDVWGNTIWTGLNEGWLDSSVFPEFLLRKERNKKIDNLLNGK